MNSSNATLQRQSDYVQCGRQGAECYKHNAGRARQRAPQRHEWWRIEREQRQIRDIQRLLERSINTISAPAARL